MKHNIYYYYVPLSHIITMLQIFLLGFHYTFYIINRLFFLSTHHLPIVNFPTYFYTFFSLSPPFYLFIFLLLSTLISLFFYPFIVYFFYFLLFLFLSSYYKFAIHFMHSFPTHKMLFLSLSIFFSPFFGGFYYFSCISTLSW